MDYVFYIENQSQDKYFLSYEMLSYMCFRDFREKQLKFCVFENSSSSLLNDDVNHLKKMEKFPQHFQMIYQQELSLSIERLKILKKVDPESYDMVEKQYFYDVLMGSNHLKRFNYGVKFSSIKGQKYSFMRSKDSSSPFFQISDEDSMRITRELVFHDHLKLKGFLLDEVQKSSKFSGLKDLKPEECTQGEILEEFQKHQISLQITAVESVILKKKKSRVERLSSFNENSVSIRL